MNTADANDLLPQRATIEKPRPEKLNYLFIAPPKFGKTTFFCDIPDALLLAFEQGHAFQKAHKMVIDCWDRKITEENPAIWQEADTEVYHGTMAKVAEVLEASDRFSFVIFDTADMAAKQCLDYHLRKHNWSHAKDGGDFGVGHDIAQNTPFRHMVGRIMRTGRGVGFITHSEVKKTELASKKETSLPNGVYKFLHTQADVILHGKFGIKQKGNRWRDRILRTEGDEETLAGSRIKDLIIPAEYIIDPSSPWGQWSGFFDRADAVTEAENNLRAAMQNAEPAADSPETPTPELSQEEAPATVKSKSRKGK